MRIRTEVAAVLVLVFAVVLVSCGGSGGGGATPATQTAVIAKGVMTKGSVIVNGIRFDDTSAQIKREDDIATTVTTTTLDDGMMVKVKGKGTTTA